MCSVYLATQYQTARHNSAATTTRGEAELEGTPVGFLEPLQCQDEQLGVMLVVEWGEGDGGEPPALQPVHHCGVDGHSLFWGDIGAVLSRGRGRKGRGRRGEVGGGGTRGEGRRGRAGKRGTRGEVRTSHMTHVSCICGCNRHPMHRQTDLHGTLHPVWPLPLPPHFEVVVLPFLLCLQVQSGQTTEVLLANCLVHLGWRGGGRREGITAQNR